MINEWTLERFKTGLYIVSNDFIYDVWLKVDGDFIDRIEEEEYALKLVERLNKE